MLRDVLCEHTLVREQEADLAVIQRALVAARIQNSKDVQTIVVVCDQRRVCQRTCLDRASEDGYIVDLAPSAQWWKVKRSKVDGRDFINRDRSVKLVQPNRSRAVCAGK
jgi:hypothetical protein